MKSFSVYNWRILIFKSDLPPNAKYVGCYLSTYMNEHGDNCYPSINRISYECGLSKPTVIKYVHILKENGWLESSKKGFDGQAWAHNQYYPNIPKKVIKELNHVEEGGKTHSIRRLNSQHKAVKELNTSSTDNSTVSSTERSYPKELNKNAWDEYLQYRKDANFKKLTKIGEDKQIEKIIRFGGYDTQQQCIDETISNGWQGIFPSKNNGSSYKSKAGRFIDGLCDDGSD